MRHLKMPCVTADSPYPRQNPAEGEQSGAVSVSTSQCRSVKLKERNNCTVPSYSQLPPNEPLGFFPLQMALAPLAFVSVRVRCQFPL